VKRREFIAGLGSAAVAWPVPARAQQGDGVRRVGMLIAGADNDPLMLARVVAVREVLSSFGWVEGRNLRIELRFGTGDTDRMRSGAADLISFSLDVILTTSTPATKAIQQQSQGVPIVFATVNDPVASGLVKNLARPEGNVTGFALYEPSIAGKWLELLKEAAPHVETVAFLYDPANAPEAYLSAFEAVARRLEVQAVKSPVRNVEDIVRTIDGLAAAPNGALLLPNDNTTLGHRELILRLAIQHRLPAIFPAIYHGNEGALLAYGIDTLDQYRGAATYIDRILRGAKVSELPVQFPTKFELVVNLKAAKAIGLTIPAEFLLRADEVIE
jgi:putative tryptophan/tyrosine transport system substrate-binding protein